MRPKGGKECRRRSTGAAGGLGPPSGRRAGRRMSRPSREVGRPRKARISPPVAAIHRKARYHIGVTDLELEQAVSRAAQQHHLQPALLLAVMKAESSFNPTVISKAGAVGLMQLIPETAIRHGVRNLYDANDNITGGAKHLRYLLDRFHGNIRLALAAYNAGEGKVDRYGQIPPYKETQDYVKRCSYTIVATRRTVGSCRL